MEKRSKLIFLALLPLLVLGCASTMQVKKVKTSVNNVKKDLAFFKLETNVKLKGIKDKQENHDNVIEAVTNGILIMTSLQNLNELDPNYDLYNQLQKLESNSSAFNENIKDLEKFDNALIEEKKNFIGSDKLKKIVNNLKSVDNFLRIRLAQIATRQENFVKKDDFKKIMSARMEIQRKLIEIATNGNIKILQLDLFPCGKTELAEYQKIAMQNFLNQPGNPDKDKTFKDAYLASEIWGLATPDGGADINTQLKNKRAQNIFAQLDNYGAKTNEKVAYNYADSDMLGGLIIFEKIQPEQTAGAKADKKKDPFASPIASQQLGVKSKNRFKSWVATVKSLF